MATSALLRSTVLDDSHFKPTRLQDLERNAVDRALAVWQLRGFLFEHTWWVSRYRSSSVQSSATTSNEAEACQARLCSRSRSIVEQYIT